MSTYVCHVCREPEECTCDGGKFRDERDELRKIALDMDEAAALLKVLTEVDFTGVGEFARLDDAEEAAVESARAKLQIIADGD